MTAFKITDEPGGLNQALFEVTHGLYVLTAVHDGTADGHSPNGQCLDAAMQITNAPPRIAIGVGKKSLTHAMIAATGRFVLNAIDRSGGVVASEGLTTPPKDKGWMDVVKRFGFQSGRDVDKFADLPHEKTDGGIPILKDAKAFYECTVLPEFTVDLETHTLFVASVDRAGTKEDGEPLTYNEYRRNMRKGR